MSATLQPGDVATDATGRTWRIVETVPEHGDARFYRVRRYADGQAQAGRLAVADVVDSEGPPEYEVGAAVTLGGLPATVLDKTAHPDGGFFYRVRVERAPQPFGEVPVDERIVYAFAIDVA